MKNPRLSCEQTATREAYEAMRVQIEKRLRASLVLLIAEEVNDEREYVLKFFAPRVISGNSQDEKRLLGPGHVRVELDAYFVLRDWRQCEVGEYCLFEANHRVNPVVMPKEDGSLLEFRGHERDGFQIWERRR